MTNIDYKRRDAPEKLSEEEVDLLGLRDQSYRRRNYMDREQVTQQLTIPFGKYKDQPIDSLDDGYKDWLSGQPWFETKYPDIHAAVR